MTRIACLYAALPLSLALAACGGGASDDAPDAAADSAAAPAAEAAAPVADEADVRVAAAQVVSGSAPAAFNQCKTCHSVEPGKAMIGPSLAGTYGAKAGQAGAGFAYSSAMKTSGLTWDDATLDGFLDNPRALVPGTKMSFAGIKDPARRAEVIAYLKSLASKAE